MPNGAPQQGELWKCYKKKFPDIHSSRFSLRDRKKRYIRRSNQIMHKRQKLDPPKKRPRSILFLQYDANWIHPRLLTARNGKNPLLGKEKINQSRPHMEFRTTISTLKKSMQTAYHWTASDMSQPTPPMQSHMSWTP